MAPKDDALKLAAEPFAAMLPDGAKVALIADGGEVTAHLSRRAAQTGSIGYGWNGKVEGADGRRYQASIQLTLIGSKDGAEGRDDLLASLPSTAG